MSVLWMRARAQLRGRVAASLFLALLVGLAGALVLAATAGARRSEAALPRFLAANQTMDAAVYVPPSSPSDDLVEARRRVAELPEVRQVFRASGWTAGALVLAVADPADPTRWHRQLGTVALDPGGSVAFGRPILVAGRLPDERLPDEVAVDEELAERRHLRAGSRVRVAAFTSAQLGPAGEGRDIAPLGAVADLLVAGIVRYPRDLLPVVTDQENLLVSSGGDLYLTPAWWRRHGPDIANYGIGLAVQLHDGQADLPRLRAGLRRLYGGEAAAEGVDASIGDFAITAGTRRAIALESGALIAFAVLTALAALLLVGQTLGRQVLVEAAESPILRALGMTRGQLVGVAVVRAAPVALAGAVLAVVGAVALSPATPLGVARRAELDPGVAVDLLVLALGAVAVVAGVLACAVLAGWRAGRAPAGGLGVAEVAGAERPSRIAEALAAASLPPTAVTGTRLALEPGRGRTAVPVRSVVTTAAAAVGALTAAAIFGASLLHLVRDPAAYGVTWDVRVGNYADPRGPELAARRLAGNPAVAAYRGLVTGVGSFVDGRSVPLLSFAPGKGSLGPAVVEGREPTRPDEVALGATTMRALGKRIGDTVEVSGVGEPQRLQVIGRVIVNAGDVGAAVAPGKGAITHVDLWRRVGPPGTPVTPSSFFVRLDPTTDRQRAIAQLERDFPNTVVFPLKQPDLTNLERVGYLPGLLAGLVALLALGTVTHALVTSVRRRRRDLAMLKTLGFTRGQVSQTVAWQATTFALVAALAGLPVGIATGRWAWRLVADQLGVVAGPVVPPVAALAIIAGALLVANLAAAGPGWVAARIRPAAVLRSE
jgi:FtsX-like permease family